MAKGWESKSVEAQMESAGEAISGTGRQLTPKELASQRKRQNLLLSRATVLNSLQNCANERYRAILQKALSDLDEQLKKIPETG